MVFYPLEKLHRLHEGYQQVFKVAGQELLLMHTDGKTHLIANRCPHAGAPLTRATLVGQVIRCPKHGVCFDLVSGCPRGGEVVADVAPLTRYNLHYEQNQIGLMVEE